MKSLQLAGPGPSAKGCRRSSMRAGNRTLNGCLTLGLAWLVVLASGCDSQSNRIVRVSRQNNSGTYHYFREAVLGPEREFKLGSIDQSGSKDVVELVSNTPLAIGFSGLGYATPEIKVLKISTADHPEGVTPSLESALDKSYPLARPLYIYLMGEPQGATRHFLNWVRSPVGQKIVTEVGYIPTEPIELEEGVAVPAAATIKVAGSDTMVNLAAAWAERYMEEFPQVDVQVNGGGSGVGIAKLIDGTIELANASRDMKGKEREKAEAKYGQPVTELVAALDALAIYVHKDNPLDVIGFEDLAEIYGEDGTITAWNQVTGWQSDE